MIPDLKSILNKRSNIREIQDKLKNNPLIESCRRTNARLYINFTDGNRELWSLLPEVESAFSYKLPDNPFEGPEVQILDQHLYNPLDDNAQQMKNLFLLDYKQWKKGNFISRRLIVHELIKRIIEEGWIPIEYYHLDLMDDVTRLMETDIEDKHLKDKVLNIYGYYGSQTPPGKLIIEQYTPWDQIGDRTIQEAWCDAHDLYFCIKHILKIKRNVTRHSLISECNRFRCNDRYGVKYICPNSYRALLRCFNLQNSIIADPNPGIGAKAIAATLEGCKYHSGSDFNNLSKFLGTKFYDLNQNNYDCVLLDENWDRHSSLVYEDVDKWLDVSDMVLVFVPREHVNRFPKPDKYLKVIARPKFFGIIDFVFCYVG